MEQEISQHLKEKLKIIEKETEFFSRKPEIPVYSRLTKWAAIVLCIVCAYFGFTSEDKTIFFMLLLVLALNFTNYYYEKQLHNMYSSAVEIIRYYKDSDTGEI